MRGVVASHDVVSALLCFGDPPRPGPAFKASGQGGNSGGKRRTFQAKFFILASSRFSDSKLSTRGPQRLRATRWKKRKSKEKVGRERRTVSGLVPPTRKMQSRK